MTANTSIFPQEAIRLVGYEHLQCFFDNCALEPPPTPAARAYAGESRFVPCRQRACLVAGAVLDEITACSPEPVARYGK